MRKPNSAVLIVPPSILIEFFALSRLASNVSMHHEASAILRGLRGLRPDISEFSAFLCVSLVGLGSVAEAREVLDEYSSSGGATSSLVLSLEAKLQFESNDPQWSQTAKIARDAFVEDGGGELQRQILSELPGMEMLMSGSLASA